MCSAMDNWNILIEAQRNEIFLESLLLLWNWKHGVIRTLYGGWHWGTSAVAWRGNSLNYSAVTIVVLPFYKSQTLESATNAQEGTGSWFTWLIK